MGGIKINRQYGRCFLCLHVKEIQRDGSLQDHPLERANPRGDRCPGGGRLPRGNGESYRYEIVPGLIAEMTSKRSSKVAA